MKLSFFFINIKKQICLFFLFFFICISSENLKAQEFTPHSELGVIGGVSYYLGDLNHTHFKNSNLSGGIVVRKNIDRRFTYKAEIILGSLNADDRENQNDSIALDRGLHFKSSFQEISGQIEFNFLPYETGNALYRWTPFVFAGVSLFHFNPQAENQNGEWVNLQELGTEGQGTSAFPDRKKYPLIQFSIPMGGGLKIGVSKSFNIIIEYAARKTFTDYLDDVSETYPGGSVLLPEGGNLAVQMSDPTGTHIAGEARGDKQDNDWYSFLGITFSFKIKNDIQGCDY